MLNTKNFYDKNYTVKKIDYDDSCDDDFCTEVYISFNETNTQMILRACSDCCDVNFFEFPHSLNVLIGSRIKYIHEDVGTRDENAQRQEYGDSNLTFEINIEYTFDSILNELKENNYNWKKLPTDIFNMISSLINSHVIFLRQNSSNGYYSGYLDISFSN